MRRLRFAVQPSRLALHAVTVALVVMMICLGRGQLTAGENNGLSLQNLAYALQWWASGSLVLVVWARAMRDAYRSRARSSAAAGEAQQGGPRIALTGSGEPAKPSTIGPPPVAYRRYVIPATTQPADDPVYLAYNYYLAKLAAADASTEDL